MILNLDFYYDLVSSFLALTKESPEMTAKFMFSGKEPLNALKNIVRRADKVQFSYIKTERKRNNEDVSHSNIPIYELKIKWVSL